MSMTQLATTGDVSDVTIARDGKLLAYVVGDGDGQSIHIREISAANERAAIAASTTWAAESIMSSR